MLGGVGSRLPSPVLWLSGTCAAIAVVVSFMSIYLQLRNYRKPLLQRMVVRIMLMVPIYAISSFISLFSLEAAFFIDAVRDIYEAFVIYCFFVLLISYLGGERSLLIMLHGRPPKVPPFPINFVKRELDVSDPYTFLFLKRGILQYVQVKPVLTIATMILKATNTYNEGNLRANSGYLYVSIVYNVSITVSLYCLALFWICVNQDLKPFRPIPKFLCVKGILFFSFWQSIGISILVATGAITKLGPYTDSESISLGLTDTLITIEMPLFAIAHLYAFSYTDFIDKSCKYIGRMPVYYAMRDAFGLLDVLEDSKATLRGEGMDYREFEPAEGVIHQGDGRERRIRAGLRYSQGGKRKYWLPQPGVSKSSGPLERRVNGVITDTVGVRHTEQVYAPLLDNQESSVVHLAPDLQASTSGSRHDDILGADDAGEGVGYEIPFGDLDETDEELFSHCKRYLFGDYNYPCIDASTEDARRIMWAEEEQILRDERGAWYSPLTGGQGRVALGQRKKPVWEGYGAISTAPSRHQLARAVTNPQGYRNDVRFDSDIDKPSSADPMDVRLRWTKLALSKSESPQMSNNQPSTSSSVSSASGSVPRLKGSLSKKKYDSSHAASPLPEDAVDLVVEDTAAEEEIIKDRKNNEPGSRQRRVYRKAFLSEASDDKGSVGEVEVEFEAPAPEDRREYAEEIIETNHPDVAESEIVAELDTTYPRIRVDGLEDDNPWA